MPNVTSLEPQILVDLLALTLQHFESNPERCEGYEVVIISPWISNVELSLHPSGHHMCLGASRKTASLGLAGCIRQFLSKGCPVRIGVLKYGRSAGGLSKDGEDFAYEKALLQSLLNAGAEIYLCPNLHAKGILTPLGVITGTTNYTRSGVHLQMQNANYFPYSHPDYAANRTQLLSMLQDDFRARVIH